MKIQDAGMILEEQPAKVAEAVKLFLQGTIFTINSQSLLPTDSRPALYQVCQWLQGSSGIILSHLPLENCLLPEYSNQPKKVLSFFYIFFKLSISAAVSNDHWAAPPS